MAPCSAAAFIAGLLFGVSAAAAQSPGADNSVWLVADRQLTIATSAGSGALALYLSRDWDRPQPDITRAIVTVHGILRNADTYRTIAEAARAASGVDLESVLLVEPQFLDEVDAAAQHLPAETLRWAGTNWEGGDDAVGPAPISSFAALDAILARLADRASFPALKTVVVAGHSGGGQLVQRYAVAGRGDSALVKAGIHVRYLVANPSSYVYFSAERPIGDEFAVFDAAACPAYDRWKYGMTGLPPYVRGHNAAELEAAYAARDVVYLLGAADTNPRDRTLDKSCMAEAEGPDHLARGLAYFRYMQRRHGTALAHRLLVAPDVGHDGDRMFTSPCGLAAVYDRPGCAAD